MTTNDYKEAIFVERVSGCTVCGDYGTKGYNLDNGEGSCVDICGACIRKLAGILDDRDERQAIIEEQK